MKTKLTVIVSLVMTFVMLLSTLGVTAYAIASYLPQTGNYLVKNNTSDYVIVMPTDADTDIKTAASELATMIEMSTGVKPESITEDRLAGRKEKIISLGNTDLFAQTGIDLANYNIGKRGYVLKTVGSNLFIA